MSENQTPNISNFAEAEIYEEDQSLFHLNNGRCVLDQRLSEKLFIIAEKHPEITHQSDGLAYERNEGGLSDLFAEAYKNEHKFCPDTNCWFSYDGGKWTRDLSNVIIGRHIREFIRLLDLYSGEIVDENIRADYKKFITKMGDRRARDRIMKDAADNEELVVTAEEFDADPYLLNCLNGTYDLRDFTFRPHSADDLLTMQTNCNFTLQETSCPRWEQFIDEVMEGDKDKAAYLQKALGYSLIGLANEECMFIMHGKTTRNGKSTISETVRVILGDYADSAPVDLICKRSMKRDPEAPSPTLASLKGKRFVTMAESDEAGRIDEGVLKNITGGEAISARALHQNTFTFIPQFTLWLSCNDLPSVYDRSLFASDRVRVIEFNRHFSEEEQDKTLKSLFKQPENQTAILAWLIAGYIAYKHFGLKMSPSMRKVVASYERDNDLILQFLEEKCEKTADGKAKAKSLYDAYKIWCRSNGYNLCSAKRFNAEVEAHPDWNKGKRSIGGYPYFDGLQLKSVP